MVSHRSEATTIMGPQHAERGFAKAHRLFEHRMEHRREVSGRGVDDVQDFRHRGLLSLAFVAFQKGLIELPPQLSVGTPKIGYLIAPDPCGCSLDLSRHAPRPPF